MTGVVHTFTVIRVGGTGDMPYAIAVVDTSAGRHTARAEGDLAWLAIGAPAELSERDAGGLWARAAGA